MFSPEMNQLIYQEQHKDRLRQIERQRLVEAIASPQSSKTKSHQKAARWLGGQLVKWGSKLQSYDNPTSSATVAGKLR